MNINLCLVDVHWNRYYIHSRFTRAGYRSIIKFTTVSIETSNAEILLLPCLLASSSDFSRSTSSADFL